MHFLLSYRVHKLFHHIFTKWPLAAILVFRFSPKSIGFFHSRSSMAVSNMNLIRVLVLQFKYVKHKLFHHIFTKWPLAAILVFRCSPKSIGFFHSRSSMAVSNMNLIRALVSQLRETQAFACGGGCGGGGGGVRTKTIISPKF